jgi:hypothetical protein
MLKVSVFWYSKFSVICYLKLRNTQVNAVEKKIKFWLVMIHTSWQIVKCYIILTLCWQSWSGVSEEGAISSDEGCYVSVWTRTTQSPAVSPCCQLCTIYEEPQHERYVWCWIAITIAGRCHIQTPCRVTRRALVWPVCYTEVPYILIDSWG